MKTDLLAQMNACLGGEAAGGQALEIRIDGVVQGVGFRPFLYGIAQMSGLFGQVRNDSEGVLLEIEGHTAALRHFATLFAAQLPPLAVVTSLQVSTAAYKGFRDFRITASHAGAALHTLPSPDAAVCAQCLAEMLDPRDRRYRYPFINCTHCGPRYSIITAMPYDRPRTSMARFPMCAACRAEYEDPANRRFHAQPIACPDCGPQLILWDDEGKPQCHAEEALQAAVECLEAGAILAMKGLGGFHLLADATSPAAVARLRARKKRPRKPFAIMYPDQAAVLRDCVLGDAEAHWLASPIAPVLLLRKRGKSTILAPEVAPECHRIGAMLPYTPLHSLLCQALARPVVATSGNLSEEPICYDEVEAWHRLSGIADRFLVHDRPIVRPLDDSIMQVLDGQPQVLRAARGIAPYRLGCATENATSVLAVGAHQKNSVALGGAGQIICSQHIGDLDSAPSRDTFQTVLADMQHFFQQTPTVWARDEHPDYASSQWLTAQGMDSVYPVQHHYAHVLSGMAEHGLDGPVLGIAWDGTGLGDDGTVWGGEALRCDWRGFQRVAHLRPFLLPGGEQAAREPWRSALGLIAGACGVDAAMAWWRGAAASQGEELAHEAFLRRMLQSEAQCVWSSSMGRLFDGVAAILKLSWRTDYEGEAAMRLEAVSDESAAMTQLLPAIPLTPGATKQGISMPWLWDWRPLVRAVLTGGEAAPVGAVAYAFHEALAGAVQALLLRSGDTQVLLTGGCFQNALLAQRCKAKLAEFGKCKVYSHAWIPPNDGGIAVGQAAYALHAQLAVHATAQTVKET